MNFFLNIYLIIYKNKDGLITKKLFKIKKEMLWINHMYFYLNFSV